MVEKVTNIQKNHKIILDNRKILSLTGIDKVDTISPTQLIVHTLGTLLLIEGKDMQIVKLDVDAGIVDVCGQVNSIKYMEGKKNILKRLFK